MLENCLNRLIDAGYQVLTFKNQLDTYTCLAVPIGEDVSAFRERWEHEESAIPLHGLNRYSGEGFTMESAVEATAYKVLAGTMPPIRGTQTFKKG